MTGTRFSARTNAVAGGLKPPLRRAAPKGHATFIYSYSTAVGEPAINQPTQLLRSC